MVRPGIKIAATIFVIIALAHLLRLVFLVPMSLQDWRAAQWISLLGVILPLVVAGLLLMDNNGRGHR